MLYNPFAKTNRMTFDFSTKQEDKRVYQSHTHTFHSCCVVILVTQILAGHINIHSFGRDSTRIHHVNLVCGVRPQCDVCTETYPRQSEEVGKRIRVIVNQEVDGLRCSR